MTEEEMKQYEEYLPEMIECNMTGKPWPKHILEWFVNISSPEIYEPKDDEILH